MVGKTPERLALITRVRELRAAGWDRPSIAVHLGITTRAVRHIDTYGRVKNLTPGTCAEVRAQLALGRPVSAVADATGVTKGDVVAIRERRPGTHGADDGVGDPLPRRKRKAAPAGARGRE